MTTTILSISQIEREIERRGMWISATSQVEMKGHALVYSWIAYIMRTRTVVTSARAESKGAAIRKAFGNLD
jgi:hypothetical protein